MLSIYCIGSPQATTKRTISSPQHSMLQHRWSNIDLTPIKTTFSTKTPKTPSQKPPPKIPNWLTKIPNKNPQAKTPTKNSQLIHQKSLAKTPQKSHLNAVKMTTNLYIISLRSGRPKTPTKKPLVTR